MQRLHGGSGSKFLQFFSRAKVRSSTGRSRCLVMTGMAPCSVSTVICDGMFGGVGSSFTDDRCDLRLRAGVAAGCRFPSDPEGGVNMSCGGSGGLWEAALLSEENRCWLWMQDVLSKEFPTISADDYGCWEHVRLLPIQHDCASCGGPRRAPAPRRVRCLSARRCTRVRGAPPIFPAIAQRSFNGGRRRRTNVSRDAP